MLSTIWTTLAKVATRQPVVVPPHATLRAAAEVMAGNSVGAVVVATENDHRTVGILSERDIVNALASGANPDEATAAGAMSHDVVSLRAHDTLYDAAVDMLDLGIRHVPLLDERGHVLGMVSVRDLLRPLLTASLSR